jgi:hypothetical protein
MRRTKIKKPTFLLCEKCGQSVYPLTGVCPVCQHTNSRLPEKGQTMSEMEYEKRFLVTTTVVVRAPYPLSSVRLAVLPGRRAVPRRRSRRTRPLGNRSDPVVPADVHRRAGLTCRGASSCRVCDAAALALVPFPKQRH